MKFELKQQFQVESARFLPHLPKEHPCSRVHGHSFKIILTMVGEADAKLGWVRDYHEIENLAKPVLLKLDHRNLNEVAGLENPTSEQLSFWIFERLKIVIPELIRVSIQETNTTECSYPA